MIKKFALFIALMPACSAMAQHVMLNEIAASVLNSFVDDYGEYEDWIEISNPSKQDVDMGGWFITDNLKKPRKWQIPTDRPDLTTILSGSFIVFWPDKDTLQGPNHLGFALQRDGEQLALFRPSGKDLVLVDSISYGKLPSDKSFGRCPEQDQAWMVLKHPTPGKANICSPVKNPQKTKLPIPEPPGYEDATIDQVVLPGITSIIIKVNEISCNNATSYADDFGEYDDWVELYNPGSSPVNIAGWYVSDTTVAATFHRIPTFDALKTTIPAGGYLILWADGQPVQGAAHLPFKFGKDGEEFYLARMVGGALEMMDQVVFPKAKNDVTYGRLPNGTGAWKRLSDPTPLAANLPPRVLSGFLVNEVMAVAGAGVVDEKGEQEDWIEFYNPTATAINIGGLYLTDTTGDLLRSRIPLHAPDSTTIPAGGYLLLFADNATWQGVRHLNFKLPAKGEKILLTQPDGITSLTEVTYPFQSGEASYGRFPNGQNTWIFTPPTPRQANIYTYSPVSGIYINEIMANNLNTFPDNLGEIEDWIELYNSNSTAVNVGGLYISDSINDPLKFRISNNYPDSTTIPPKGFLVFWADNDPQQGVRHLDIKLSGLGETLTLSQYRAVATTLDSHSYGLQTENISIGRFPDGASSWYVMSVPTPGAINKKQEISGTTGIYINELMARNTRTLLDDGGRYEDWIELYNSTNQMIDIGGLYISDSKSEPLKQQIPLNNPTKTQIQPKGYLLLWADLQRTIGPLHCNFELAGAGESLSLVQVVNGQNFYIDSISYPVQTADVSYGRLGDAAPWWNWFRTPTPNARNSTQSILNESIDEADLVIFPNPFTDEMDVHFTIDQPGLVEIQLYSVDGRIVFQLSESYFDPGRKVVKLLLGSSLNQSGCYFLKVKSAERSYYRKIIKID